MNFDKYVNKLPYASRKKDPAVFEAYKAEQFRLHAEFKKDLFEELGITGHPKAEILFNIAWDNGHASGHSEVHYFACELVDLIK